MRTIFLLLTPLFLFISSFHHLKLHTVTGRITDEKGNHLTSASIVLKGGSVTAMSQTGGTYSISVPDGNGTLVFSQVGYETKEIPIKGRAVINVVLKPATQALQEVVIVGYQTEKKQTITGSVSTARNKNKAATLGVQGNSYYPHPQFNTEEYDHISENGFKKVADDPLSTFSIDVDAASYSNIRRFINQGQLPPAGAVRVEEMINYFRYDYEAPKDDKPFSVFTELSDCPWNNRHKLVMIGLQGKKIPVGNLPPSNLVFLVDVSGSMMSENKLPLVKASLKLLVDQLREEDRVAIVVYAGAAGLVLPSTNGADKTTIKDAIDQLAAGGSTAGGEGIRLAYKVARDHFVKGNNRVILCSDGDFNVGVSSNDELERLIEQERKSGVYLTILGYGMGNYKDSKMQHLANKGNGNHAYIDGLSEARKVLVSEFGGTLFTIAKDVKLQVEFNPAQVQGYRLVGYENRLLNKEDFNDDTKDAGELGSGHTVTALYEIVPAGIKSDFLKDVDDLRYQKNGSTMPKTVSGEVMNIKLRYKLPGNEVSRLLVHPVANQHKPVDQTSENFRFASSVAQFGMLLRQSPFRQNSSYNSVIQLATKATGSDTEGYRKEFIELVKKTMTLNKSDDMTVK